MGRSTWMRIGTACLIQAGAALAAETEGETPSLFSGGYGTAIWQLVVFVVLIVVLGKFAWPNLLDALRKREDRIRGELDEASRQRKEAQDLLSQYESKLAAAQVEAEKILKSTSGEAERIKTERLHEAQKQAQETLMKVTGQVELAKREALREIYGKSADLAADLAARILGREVNAEDHRVLIHESLETLDELEPKS